MSTSNTNETLPSFEALRSAGNHARFVRDMSRLFWALNGPLETSIWVLDDEYSPDLGREAYFRQTVAGTSWHPISQLPITRPGVSSITLRVYQLDKWEDDWFEYHDSHANPDDPECVYGSLPDYNSDEDEEGPEHLLECCGAARPRKKRAQLMVRASAEFVTIHDYVSAVHPWLMSLRDDILQAVALFEDRPLPTETKLALNYNGLTYVMVDKEEEWISNRKNAPSWMKLRLDPASSWSRDTWEWVRLQD